tara:strand:+ start:1193 stop:1480 length:288 start_codon:yes stop_codon:yes gene_type:complete
MAKGNLRRIDLAKIVSQKKGFPLLFSKKLIDNLIDVLIFSVSKNKLNLKNIGTFNIVKKNSRLGRNPKTRQEFIITARKSISFKPSKTLLKKINN